MTTYIFLIAVHLGTQKSMTVLFTNPDDCLEARTKFIATVPHDQTNKVVVECVVASPIRPEDV